MSTVALLGLSALFIFLVYSGLKSKRGSQCGRGWLSFLLLPVTAGLLYSTVISRLNVTSPYVAIGGFAVFLAVIQYVLTVVSTMRHKPNAPKGRVLTRALIAPAIILAFSMVMMILFTVAKNTGPFKAIFRAVDVLGSVVPGVSETMSKKAHLMIALSPLAAFAALGAHGIACSTV